MAKKQKILVVDDERLPRWAAKERLAENEHFELDEADSAASALEKAQPGAFDLVLLDIGLGDGSGIDVLAELKGRDPALKVIMLTAENKQETTLECLRRGAFDYLCKPIDLDAIDAVVSRALVPPKKSRPSASTPHGVLEQFIGQSKEAEAIRRQVGRVITSRASTVLIQGESGTGKEVLSKAIHEGTKPAGPFMTINCTAVPATLMESELFGHEKGAFTDAKTQKKGLFELADKGTLLLDEIGDLDLFLQAKLLRVIEERSFKRVGGTEEIKVDLRIIATTNVDLQKAVAEGRFRSDLFYRLNVIPIHVSPLRDRLGDIPLLVDHFVDLLNRELNTTVNTVSAGAMSLLCRFDWPGNARQLKNLLERVMVVESGDTILVDHLPTEIRRQDLSGGSAPEPDSDDEFEFQLPGEGVSLDTVERELIRQALERAKGNITQAAALVGLHRDTLRYRARKHGLIEG